MDQLVYRFAPSPNGRLHLGHAFSALINQKMARDAGAKFLIRIEDTDITRCTPFLEQKMLDDLNWLGIEWDEEPKRQSDHFEKYQEVLGELQDADLVYPSFMTRGELKRRVMMEEKEGKAWPVDPDGSPLYPSDDKNLSNAQRSELINADVPYALRLNMSAALEFLSKDIFWREQGSGPDGESGDIKANPAAWGDVILSRKDTPASYHLACVVDDALQGITNIVRGRDLFFATAVHRVLQELLGYKVPEYFHHDLILNSDGQKLSKSQHDTSLADLRKMGNTPSDIKKMIRL